MTTYIGYIYGWEFEFEFEFEAADDADIDELQEAAIQAIMDCGIVETRVEAVR